jgi:hypothetical protein
MRSSLRPSPAMVVALIALFVALGGTAAAAVIITDNSEVAQGTISGHKPPSGKHANIIAGSVNATDLADKSVTPKKLSAVAKFRRSHTNPTPILLTEVLSLGGLHVHYGCPGAQNFEFNPRLTATTTVDHASITLGFITGEQGFGSAFTDRDTNFRPGETLSLTKDQDFGQGTLVYSNPSNQVVTLNYGFGSSCSVHGVAIKG